MINQPKIADDTVDGRNPASQLRLVVFPIIFLGFLHPRWCRISSINSRVIVFDSSKFCKALCVSFLNNISCQSETTWAVMLLESKSSHPTHGGRRSFPFGFRPNFQGILQLVSGRVNIGLFVKIVIFTCRKDLQLNMTFAA